jgi:tRNA-binding protein
MKEIVSYKDFSKIDIRVGKILYCQDFPQAKKAAYKLEIDFGAEIGIKTSSAQITKHYSKEELIGKVIIAVVNFPPKQIAGFLSEVLVLGVVSENDDIVLLELEADVSLGSKIL